jgi:murein L,D-transpeptidase YcbB/YkuD
MSGPRCDRLLAGTALALLLAAPFDLCAQEAIKEGDKLAAVPTQASPARQGTTDQGTTDSSAPTDPSDAGPATAPAPAASPEQVPPPDPLAALDPADRPVAEKIRDFLAAKPDKIFASRNERAAVETFYQKRNLAPLWLDKGIENARAKAVIARLKNAEADGLDLRDYRVPSFAGLAPDALAEADVKLTQTVLTYARHLQAGRFPYNRVSQNNIQLPQAAPEPAAILAAVVDAADAGKALDQFSPPHEAYQKLKAKLAEIRAKSARPEREIPDGPVLKLNVKTPTQDPRVPLLRTNLGLSGDPNDLTYDANLAGAVRRFQQASDLPGSGILDSRTVKALNGPATDKHADLIIANMERWRWYPRDLGADYSIVNQPDFTMKVMHNGAQVWTTKVVIGEATPGKNTPLLSETMKSITVNPTWNVPPSILYNEYLPALQRDPTVLTRMGLNVSYNRDGSVHVSQPPGGANVLGRLRFNFPNRFLVYQHDTNEKFMFAHDVRAQSHGCMRVQDPAKYAEVLLNLAKPEEHWSVERVTRMFSGGEQDIALPPGKIWVHSTYQSAFVDEHGKLQVRRDVYNMDARTIAAIRSERVMIETAPEGKKDKEKEPEVASAQPRRKAAAPPTVSFLQSFFFGQPARPPRPVRGGTYYR